MKRSKAVIWTVSHEPDVDMPPARRSQAKAYRPDSLVAFGFEGATLVNALQLADPVSIGSGKRNNDEIKGCDSLRIG